MLSEGHDVWFFNLVSSDELGRLQALFGEKFGNPSGLKNVLTCVIETENSASHEELRREILNCKPDVLVGGGHIATLSLGNAAPELCLVFSAGGSPLTTAATESRSLADLLQGKLPPASIRSPELSALQRADLILTHSPLIKGIYEQFYPEMIYKIHPRIVWMGSVTRHEAEAFSSLRRIVRDIDVIFIASLWDRREKGFELVKEIIRRLPDIEIHVVGEVPERVGSATYHGLITSREDLYSLMGRSKILVCPSDFDAAPGVLFEASAMGCQVIASKRCGNWGICNPSLVIDHPDAEEFMQKIGLALDHPLPGRYDESMEEASYADFVRTVSRIERA